MLMEANTPSDRKVQHIFYSWSRLVYTLALESSSCSCHPDAGRESRDLQAKELGSITRTTVTIKLKVFAPPAMERAIGSYRLPFMQLRYGGAGASGHQ